eukprot:5965536-Prymnesium_polylepis.1
MRSVGSAHGSTRYDPRMQARSRARGTQGSEAAASRCPSFALPPNSLPRQPTPPRARQHYAGRHDCLPPADWCVNLQSPGTRLPPLD